jgi:2',3'-cyclic-nucleotide 2'-phosphodiesterase (5'-nucleotidase family)
MRKIFYIAFICSLFSCTKNFVPRQQKLSHSSVNTFYPSQLVEDSLRRFRNAVISETNRVLVQSETVLIKEGNETELGNFVCDALAQNVACKKYGVDIVLLNRGGLRANLPRGEILVKHIFELMPFENELVILTLRGEQLYDFARLVKEKKHPFRGLKIKIDTYTTVLFNGVEIDLNKEYRIATSDYLADGGDAFTFLAHGSSRINIGFKIRDIIISYCENIHRAGNVLKAYKDGRLEISE